MTPSRRVTLILALTAALTSCSHARTVPLAPSDALRAVFVHEGTPYLFSSFAFGLEAVASAGVEMEACLAARMSENGRRCVLPAPASLAEGTPPATISLLTPRGPCEARVGALSVIGIEICETTTIVAWQLTGCEGPFASVGLASGAFDPELRYLPAPTPTRAQIHGASEARALSPDTHRERVLAWLADPEIVASPLQDGAAASLVIDVGEEWLESSAITLLVGVADTCDQSLEYRAATGIRRGDAFVPVSLDAEWDGVVARRGRVVGITTNAPYSARLLAIDEDGAVREVFNERVWSDNEECHGETWASLEHPCGP